MHVDLHWHQRSVPVAVDSMEEREYLEQQLARPELGIGRGVGV